MADDHASQIIVRGLQLCHLMAALPSQEAIHTFDTGARIGPMSRMAAANYPALSGYGVTPIDSNAARQKLSVDSRTDVMRMR